MITMILINKSDTVASYSFELVQLTHIHLTRETQELIIIYTIIKCQFISASKC